MAVFYPHGLVCSKWNENRILFIMNAVKLNINVMMHPILLFESVFTEFFVPRNYKKLPLNSNL